MTNLVKAVSRRTMEPFSWKGKRLIATLAPGDVLILRPEGTPSGGPSEVSVPLASAYTWALAHRADRMTEAKKLVRRGK